MTITMIIITILTTTIIPMIIIIPMMLIAMMIGSDRFCLTIEEPLPAQVFDSWLEMLVMFNGVNVLRVKGIINLAEMDKPLVIHGVQHIWHPPEILDNWPSSDRRSRIVFILRDLEETELRKMLALCKKNSQEHPSLVSRRLASAG